MDFKLWRFRKKGWGLFFLKLRSRHLALCFSFQTKLSTSLQKKKIWQKEQLAKQVFFSFFALRPFGVSRLLFRYFWANLLVWIAFLYNLNTFLVNQKKQCLLLRLKMNTTIFTKVIFSYFSENVCYTRIRTNYWIVDPFVFFFIRPLCQTRWTPSPSNLLTMNTLHWKKKKTNSGFDRGLWGR